ncbi:unnamed protein product [Discula destructiva]
MTEFSFAVPTSNERRLGRPRTRDVPQDLPSTTTAARTQPVLHTAPLPRHSITHRDDAAAAAVNSLFDHSAENMPVETLDIASENSGTESDTDSCNSGPARKRQALQPLDTSFQELQFTDFSNHLGNIGADMDADMDADMEAESLDSFTLAEPEAAAAFSVMSPDPDGDVWGWNAVLEGKNSSSAFETSTTYQQRRASRSKRSLLQRVFSPASSSVDDISSQSPTSMNGLDFEAQER